MYSVRWTVDGRREILVYGVLCLVYGGWEADRITKKMMRVKILTIGYHLL